MKSLLQASNTWCTCMYLAPHSCFQLILFLRGKLWPKCWCIKREQPVSFMLIIDVWYQKMLPSPSSDWDSLCVEHALQNSGMDWCSSDWTQHSCPFSTTAIWGTLISSQLLYVFNTVLTFHLSRRRICSCYYISIMLN